MFLIPAGLASHYRENIQCHSVVRKLLALPLLPHEHMLPAYRLIETGVSVALNSPPAILSLTSYVEATWLSSTVWPVATITVYKEHVRTNNDVKGWHRRLNHQARRASLPFYVMIRLLYAEASVATLQARLVSEGRLRRHSRKKYATIDSRLWGLWDEYAAGNISTSRLLRSASRLQLPNWMAQ